MKTIKFKKIINITICALVIFSIFMVSFALRLFEVKTPNNPIAGNLVPSAAQNISAYKQENGVEEHQNESEDTTGRETTESTEPAEDNSEEAADNTSYEIPPNIQVDYIILPSGNIVAADNNQEPSNAAQNNANINKVFDSLNINSPSVGNHPESDNKNTDSSEETMPVFTNPVTNPTEDTESTVPVDIKDVPSFKTNLENNSELESKHCDIEITHLNNNFTPSEILIFLNDDNAPVPQFNGSVLLEYGKNTIKIVVSYKDKNGEITAVFQSYNLFVKSPEISIRTNLQNQTVNAFKFNFTAAAYTDTLIPVTVTHNGQAVSGNVSYSVNLKDGENIITLSAEAYGKEKTESYTVTYNKPEKPTLVTSLVNGITVNTNQFNFEAYIEGGSDKAKLQVIINDSTVQGDTNYTANLKIGNNAIRLKVTDDTYNIKENYVYYIKYVPITTSETKPRITSINLTDGMNLKGAQFRLIVTAESYSGNKINADGMVVRLNGSGRLTPAGTDEYSLYFQNGVNTITVELIDEIGYTATYEYTIHCQKVNIGDPIGTVTISVDANTLGLGYIIEPDTVTIYEGKSIAQTIVEFLDSYSIDCDYSGSYEEAFYLQRIYQSDIGRWVEIPPELIEELNNDGITWTDFPIDSIGEQDFTRSSGWMYSVNGIYVNHGFSDCVLKDGDEVKLRYTLALGKDIGAASSTGGSGGNYSKVW